MPLASRHDPCASHGVRLDHFAKKASHYFGSSSQEDGPDSNESETHGDQSVLSEDTLGDGFRFDKYLKARWDRAAEERITLRKTGVTFKDLRVVGLGAARKYQNTIFSVLNPLNIISHVRNILHPPIKNILEGFEGTVRPGEMLLVLGQPGSGCSTFLRTLANERGGFHAVEGEISYDGISPEAMEKHYRGDTGYSPEDDIHFPALTVRQTLIVSAAARAPHMRIGGQPRQQYINNLVDILGMVFGLTHTFNTKVGDEHIRGVSGGEKKRVSIAEMMSTRVQLACWDNSTRGLDASTALEFTTALRIATDIAKVTTIVTIYQASENIYRLFNKVAVLDAGRLSYFGPAEQARDYFINMGYEPANRQTTADFLVSVTDPTSRTARKGCEARVPRTPEEFATYFKESHLGKANAADVQEQLYNIRHDEQIATYQTSARAEHATRQPGESPYTISLYLQLGLLMRRRVQIMKGDLAPRAILAFNFIWQALIMGSIFLNLPVATSAFFSRGGVLFFSILYSALTSMAEIPALYVQRPIVARHQRGALYHPFVDALALTIVDTPISLSIILVFDIILYFMTHLQRRASNFFIFLLFTFLSNLTMKAFYRGLAASFAKPSEAQAVAGLGTLVLVIYTGYTIPRPTMIGALKWITYLNPVTYAFESLVANEFHGLHGKCSTLIPSGPGYENVNIANQVCSILGSVSGSDMVDGDRFIEINFGYKYSHLWRNLGILLLFWFAFLLWFLYQTERGGNLASGGATQLIFKRGTSLPKTERKDEEEHDRSIMDNPVVRQATTDSRDDHKIALCRSQGVFSWHHLTYEIQLSGGKYRRLLDDVSGYVVPGKLTALLGESGAGKTTLLNALAERVTTGVLTGDRLINGGPLPVNFAAQTGYCQQMDIHLETASVREALRFSAVVRQPATVSRAEKYSYVEEVIRMCEMESYAEAIVGMPGEGLNVEQRKRLTIGVELAAKPQLLLFLDEPTSGLSSQNAWAIMKLLRSLADHGQAILCTIHQPSSELFHFFDSLLLLRKGGQPCYFGDFGRNSSRLIHYFEHNGARKCEDAENPAEYILDVVGAGATARSSVDWHAVWTKSALCKEMHQQLDDITKRAEGSALDARTEKKPPVFPAPIRLQLTELLRRAYLNYFRSVVYLASKLAINIFAGLFIGFTFFKTKHNYQGVQNSLFACFMGAVVGSFHSNMLQVPFIRFREIYEDRERQSKMYHWIPLVTSNLLVETPFNVIGSTIFFLCWYWTIGWPGEPDRAGFQYFVYGVIYPLYYTTLSQAVASVSSTPEIASLIFGALFSIALVFSGVLQPFNQLIKFWHWLYHLSPYTYFIETLAGNGFGKTALQCSEPEIVTLTPPIGQSCQDFMDKFIQSNGGYLLDGSSMTSCHFCPVDSADKYLSTLNIYFRHRWRDVGFLFAYILFNMFMIYFGMYMFRVRTWNPFRLLATRLRKICTTSK